MYIEMLEVMQGQYTTISLNSFIPILLPMMDKVNYIKADERQVTLTSMFPHTETSLVRSFKRLTYISHDMLQRRQITEKTVAI